jgi:hypothetical protein
VSPALKKRAKRKTTRKPGSNGNGNGKNGSARANVSVNIPRGETAAESPEWRQFVGRWLEAHECKVEAAPRGDWEVELSAALQKRWRRLRVRLVFDPARATVPRGGWFIAPGSAGGRRILDAALSEPIFTRRTALAQVPGAPADGIASVCRVRGFTWGPPRLGPVRYERRVAFHAVITRWGGLPWQEQWVVLVGAGGEVLERSQAAQMPDVRRREGSTRCPKSSSRSCASAGSRPRATRSKRWPRSASASGPSPWASCATTSWTGWVRSSRPASRRRRNASAGAPAARSSSWITAMPCR